MNPSSSFSGGPQGLNFSLLLRGRQLADHHQEWCQVPHLLLGFVEVLQKKMLRVELPEGVYLGPVRYPLKAVQLCEHLMVVSRDP